MGAPAPQFMQQPFANNADPAFIDTIPNTTGDAGRASLNLGFPPQTMTPIIAGGTPPFGQDMNGILYMLSTHVYAAQAGQAPLFSTDVATAISGYALGTVLGSTDGSTLWFNITAGNTTDPDGGSSAGWIPLKSYGITTVAGLTGGSTTLSVAQARKSVIFLTGTLIANQTIVLPAWVAQQWLIANATTGAFTLTVKTLAGTGVIVPQGGFAEPVGVYCDGTNIQPVITPLSIPTSTGPDPDTYALRTNAGYLLATYFNMSGAADNLALTNVMYDTGDGFLRRMTQANFRAQLFVDAALTGTPTAPTATPGTNDTTIASTAFVQATLGSRTYGGKITSGGALTGPAGWSCIKLPGAGRYQVVHNVGVVLAAVPTANLAGVTDDRYANILGENTTSFTIQTLDVGSGAVDNACSFIAKEPG